jgi:hypothetical protein
VTATVALLGLSGGATHAAPILLDDSFRCGAGNAVNGISVTDVTGNLGGANECWGTFDGTDPGPAGDGFQIGATVYDFVAKQNTPGDLEGLDIGLDVQPAGGALSGTWSYDPAKFDPSEFLIVLKAANSPGYGAWLFDGAAADSFSGTWLVAWERELSHLSIYAPENGGQVPVPGVLALLGVGLLGIGAIRRQR